MTRGRRGSLALRRRALPGSPGALLHRGPLRTGHARSRAPRPKQAPRAVQHRREGPAPQPPYLLGGPPVRSPRCSTCPSVPASASGSLHGLTCPRQRPCGHEHQARYPASYTRTIREDFPGLTALAFLLPSAAGIRLLGTLSRQRGSAPLTIGLPPRLRVPAPARRTLARFTRFARMRPRPGRAPSIPRGQRCSPVVIISATPPAASQRPVPVTPVQRPNPGCALNEASARVP